MTVIIMRGDARDLPLPDESVDLIVTSPPYFGQRSYTDGGEHYAGQIGSEATAAEYIASLLDCTREWVRVLKPSGSLFVNLGDKYVADGRGSGSDAKRGAAKHAPRGAAGYVGRETARHKSLLQLPHRYAIGCTDMGLILRLDIIWAKLNSLPEGSVTDRAWRTHEDIFHFTREPRYFADTDAMREPYEADYAVRKVRYGDNPRVTSDWGPSTRFDRNGKGSMGFGGARINALGKLPGSVWEIASQPLVVPDHIAHARCCGGRKRSTCAGGLDHHAAFPTEIPRRCIAPWSPPGGLVLDPFGGTGTTALVADVLGRTGISVDRSADYCRLATWRTTDPGERAKAMQVPKPPPVADGQGDLFSLEAS